MDLWVVAAATGAGYVAKYWKNLSKEKDCSMESSSMLSNHQSEQCKVLDIMPDTVFPLTKLARRWFFDGDGSSAKENGKFGKDLQDHTELPVSGLPPNFTKKQVFQENIDEINGKSECFDKSSYYLHELRTKKTNSDYFSSLRPLLATSRGRRLISRPDNDMKTRVDGMIECKMPREALVFLGEKDALFEPVGSEKLPGKPKDAYGNKLSATRESGNGMVLLLIGITIGALSTAFADQREVENLSKLLEHAEDLVQDLHNELAMKESFTVKAIELASDISLTPLVPGTVASSSRAELDEYIEYEIKNKDNPKAENFESRDDIEAELEAELERLEENMKRSIVQSISDVLEIDSDHEADITRGDLKLDTLSNLDHNDKTGKFYDPNLTPEYAVSSLDLSLRLHKVIESRLRARIRELEAVLQNSAK